jgi:hypothetical protein
MEEIEKDKYIEYVSSDASREAWRCTLCKKAGSGFYRCYRHVKGTEHSDELTDLEADMAKADEAAAKETAKAAKSAT